MEATAVETNPNAIRGTAVAAQRDTHRTQVGSAIWRHRLLLSLCLLVGVHLIPVWCCHYFPSQDGPAHVENARILEQLVLHRDSTSAPIYKLNHPVPNLLGHVILAGLMAVRIPPAVAEKMLVSLFVIGLPLSVWYASRGLRRGGGWVALFSLPFIFSLPLHKGLYNFCLSWPLMFVMIGFWLRRRESMSWRSVIAFGTLGVLTYFSHVMSLVIGLMVIAISGGWLLAVDFYQATTRQRRKAIAAQAVRLFLAALPPALLLGIFFARPSKHAAEAGAASRLLPAFLRLDALCAFHPQESALAGCVSALLGAALVGGLIVKFRQRRFDAWDILLLVVAAAILLYFIVPNNAAGGGGQISFRLSLYPYLLLPLWIAVQPPIVFARMKRFLGIGIVVVALSILMIRTIDQRDLNALMADVAATGQQIPPGQTAFLFCESEGEGNETGRHLADYFRPSVHALGHVSAERGVIDLSNYEADLNYFPVIYRNGFTWEQYLKGNRDDLQQLERGVGRPLAYVVYRTSTPPRDSPRLSNLKAELEQHYQLIYTSSHGLVKLYRRKAWDAPTRPT